MAIGTALPASATEGAQLVAVGGIDAEVGDLDAGSEPARQAGLWADADIVRGSAMVTHLGGGTLGEAMATINPPPARGLARPDEAPRTKPSRTVEEIRIVHIQKGSATKRAAPTRKQRSGALAIFGVAIAGLVLAAGRKETRIPARGEADASAGHRMTVANRRAVRRYPPRAASGLNRVPRRFAGSAGSAPPVGRRRSC